MRESKKAATADHGTIEPGNSTIADTQVEHALSVQRDVLNGIIRLRNHVDFSNFTNTCRLTSETQKKTGIRPAWWRAPGIRLNFAIYEDKMFCYRCNFIINARKGISRLRSHLDSDSHKEKSRLYFALNSLPPENACFPVTTGKGNKTSVQANFYECDVIKEILENGANLYERRKKGPRKKGSRLEFAGKMLDFMNSFLGEAHGEHIENMGIEPYKKLMNLSHDMYNDFQSRKEPKEVVIKKSKKGKSGAELLNGAIQNIFPEYVQKEKKHAGVEKQQKKQQKKRHKKEEEKKKDELESSFDPDLSEKISSKRSGRLRSL